MQKKSRNSIHVGKAWINRFPDKSIKKKEGLLKMVVSLEFGMTDIF